MLKAGKCGINGIEKNCVKSRKMWAKWNCKKIVFKAGKCGINGIEKKLCLKQECGLNEIEKDCFKSS